MSEELENSEISQPEQVSHEYGGSEIQVLEGLEAVPQAARHVYRFHLFLRSPSSGV